MTLVKSKIRDINDPFGMLNHLLEFSDKSFNQNATYPPHNIYVETENDSDKKKLVLEFALAGFSKDDISISLNDGNILTVSGEMKKKEEITNKMFQKQQIASRSFKTKYTITNDFLSEPVADFKDGMLRISFDSVQPERKMISIN